MAVPQSQSDGGAPRTVTVRCTVWNPGAPTSRRYVPAVPGTKQVGVHSMVLTTPPDISVTNAPGTEPPVAAAVTLIVMAIGMGHGRRKHLPPQEGSAMPRALSPSSR